MRYALVDDATLGAAERMEGKKATRNTLEVAGDIIALEMLIQAVLFYDHVVCLNRNWNGKNTNFQLFDSFSEIVPEPDAYDKLLDLANSITDDQLPCIEGGIFTDACFQKFFQALDMELRFIWEKKSDVFYFTPRIIRKEKDATGLLYQKLLNILLSELSDKNYLDKNKPRIPLLYDAEGQIINDCYQVRGEDGKTYPAKLSHQTEALFKALNYMVFRSNVHLLAAKALKADLILSPLRSQFQWSYLRQDEISSSVSAYKMPQFAIWIAEHMSSDSGFLQQAFELKEREEFTAARRLLSKAAELMECEDKRDSEAVQRVFAELNGQFSRITQIYGLASEKDSQPVLYALIDGAQAPLAKLSDFGPFPFPPDAATTAIEPGKRSCFGMLHRPVRQAMIHMDSLSEYFDALTSRINYQSEKALLNIKAETGEQFEKKNPHMASV